MIKEFVIASVLIVSLCLGCLYAGDSPKKNEVVPTPATQDKDYKRLYLEQKIQSLRLEANVLRARYEQIQEELPDVAAELEEYIRLSQKGPGAQAE